MHSAQVSDGPSVTSVKTTRITRIYNRKLKRNIVISHCIGIETHAESFLDQRDINFVNRKEEG